MTDALSKHTFNDEYYKHNKKRAKQRRNDRKHNRNKREEEDKEEQEGVSFAEATKTKQCACYKCGKTDHAFSKCPSNLAKKNGGSIK